MVAVNWDLAFQTEEHGSPPPNYDSEHEILSLCDLPLYGDDFDSFQEDHINSTHEDDPFEFSISEEISSKPTNDVDNVIFCGRLIPYVRQSSAVSSADSCVENKVDIAAHKPKKRRPFFIRWKLRMAFRKKKSPMPYKKVKDVDHLDAEKIRSSASEKYRWYLLIFGSARFPVSMELQDMKTRQTRRNCKNMKHHNYLTKFHMSEHHIGVDDTKVKSGNWGLWRLLKTMSCRSSSIQEAGGNAVTKC